MEPQDTTNRLRLGAILVDLENGGIYGDLAHCPQGEMLESAAALLELLPQVQHRSLWGLAKDYDATCHVYTTSKSYRVPQGLTLPTQLSGSWEGRPFRLSACTYDRDRYWHRNCYYEPIGSLVAGMVTDCTEDVEDMAAPARAGHGELLSRGQASAPIDQEPGAPEAGLQLNFNGRAVPVRPKGNGSPVQLTFDDALKLQTWQASAGEAVL